MLSGVQPPDITADENPPTRTGRLHLAQEMSDGQLAPGRRAIEVVAGRVREDSGGGTILGTQQVHTGAALLRLETEHLQTRIERASAASRTTLLRELRPFGETRRPRTEVVRREKADVT